MSIDCPKKKFVWEGKNDKPGERESVERQLRGKEERESRLVLGAEEAKELVKKEGGEG